MSVRILIGDVRDKLRELPDESVHCVVTSPPYFGLRDYGTSQWEGGDPACDHLKGDLVSPKSTLRSDGREHTGPYNGEKAAVGGMPFLRSCGKCGATRIDQQIGLEPTPADFVAVMVEVFREVRRVLRKDGTCWVNLGDSYAAGKTGRTDGDSMPRPKGGTYQSGLGSQRALAEGLKQKDLIGIPWRVAFALQADGWYLRQDIIWAKPNPMPESVTDRCTKSHEYLFLLSKSARYHYDQEAILEPVSPNTNPRISQDLMKQIGSERAHAGGKTNGNMKAVIRAPKTTTPGQGIKNNQSFADATCMPVIERNRRSVWTIATQPYKEAHFATFPPDLVEPCILAGCPKDCCANCGAPVVREVEKTIIRVQDAVKAGKKGLAMGGWEALPPAKVKTLVTGLSPSCFCNAGTVRGTVLDPFGGAGTTGLVADRLQRDAILIELNPQYAAMAKERLSGDAPLFAEVS